MQRMTVAATDIPRSETLLCELSGIHKSYGPVRALRDASLSVRPGEVLGICGHNGAGKSTLIKVMAGAEQADEGVFRFDGEETRFANVQAAQRGGVALVEQELSVVSQLSVADNMVLGNVDEPVVVRRRELDQRVRRLLARVGLDHIDPRTPLEKLPLGEQQLVEIGRLLGRRAQLLILDEPTAMLRKSEIDRVFDALRVVVAEGKTVIFVSHRLDEVLTLCNRVLVLRDGEVVATEEVARMTKPKLIELMLGTRGQELPAPSRKPRSERTVHVSNLTVPGAVDDVSFSVPGGTIVGLAGQIGAGTSEVLRALGGLIPNARGEVLVGGRRLKLGSPRRALAQGVQFISNDRKSEGLFLEHPIDLNLVATRMSRLDRMGWLSPIQIRKTARGLAELAMVPRDRLNKAVGALSGGNQQKVLLGRCLDTKHMSLLLLDEPTRGVDVGGRAELHRLIRKIAATGATVLFSSTELDELLELSDTTISMFDGRIVNISPRSQTNASRLLSEMTQESTTAESVGTSDSD
jgi:ABC-type sugar transport system ATPase subunit